MNKLPAKAGITKLINQMPEAVKTIPKVLVLAAPKSKRASCPRSPNSAKAIVGTTAMARNIIHVSPAACQKLMCTLNT